MQRFIIFTNYPLIRKKIKSVNIEQLIKKLRKYDCDRSY